MGLLDSPFALLIVAVGATLVFVPQSRKIFVPIGLFLQSAMAVADQYNEARKLLKSTSSSSRRCLSDDLGCRRLQVYINDD